MTNLKVFAVYNGQKVNWGERTYPIRFVAVDADLTDDEIKLALKNWMDDINEEYAKSERRYIKHINPLENFGKKPELDIINVAEYMEITNFISSKETILNAVRNKELILGYDDPIGLVHNVISSMRSPELYDFKMKLGSILDDISYKEYMAAVKNIPYIQDEEDGEDEEF